MYGRYKGHMRNAEKKIKRHVYNWIRSLNSDPILIVLDEVDESDACEAEVAWITYAIMELQLDLTNATIGGDGVPGLEVPVYVRTEISRKLKGRKLPSSTCSRMSASRSGSNHWAYGLKGEANPLHDYEHTEQSKKNMSEAKMGEKNPRYGVKESEETREKKRNSQIRRYSNYEQRRIQSENYKTNENVLNTLKKARSRLSDEDVVERRLSGIRAMNLRPEYIANRLRGIKIGAKRRKIRYIITNYEDRKLSEFECIHCREIPF